MIGSIWNDLLQLGCRKRPFVTRSRLSQEAFCHKRPFSLATCKLRRSALCKGMYAFLQIIGFQAGHHGIHAIDH